MKNNPGKERTVMLSLLAVSCIALAQPAVAIGPRLELLVDDALIAELRGGAALRLHAPVPREIALVCDAPWEGNSCGYFNVFQDGALYRMYYRSGIQTLKGETESHGLYACYAESDDGIHWRKPELGLIAFNGSTANNIVWEGADSHDFSPFMDTNPACPPEARYKAVGSGLEGKLVAWQSPDGIHWQYMNNGDPIITTGAFDSDNIAFWDSVRGEYRAYVRDFHDGLRDIRTATSNDFIHWTEPVWLEYPGAPADQLYTNGVIPYDRAPQIYLGFPTRYLEKSWGPALEGLPDVEHRRKRSEVSMREGTALTDGLFMSSRDGRVFHRWAEAFIRPGLRTHDNWVYGDNYQAYGMVETASAIADAPKELSIYATEGYWKNPGDKLRRFTLRVDGFVSLNAPMSGGEMITKPLLLSGKRLLLNYSTSAAGSVRIEVQREDGIPVPGFDLEHAPELFGDSLEQAYPFAEGCDLSALAGTPVRLRFALKDADVYAFRVEE